MVSGPSGSGKTTVMRSVMSRELVSFTTRAPRVGEVEGRDYYFISLEEYLKLDPHDILEHTCYRDNHYGVFQWEFDSKLCKDTFVIVDYPGMQAFKLLHPSCVTIFIYAPRDEVIERMIQRGDAPEMVQKRLATYEEELANAHLYDHVIVNDDDQFVQSCTLVDAILNK